jgi:hypothetical protein
LTSASWVAGQAGRRRRFASLVAGAIFGVRRHDRTEHDAIDHSQFSIESNSVLFELLVEELAHVCRA